MDNRGRQIFYVIGGGYLLYLAYKLLTTVKNQEGEEARFESGIQTPGCLSCVS